MADFTLSATLQFLLSGADVLDTAAASVAGLTLKLAGLSVGEDAAAAGAMRAAGAFALMAASGAAILGTLGAATDEAARFEKKMVDVAGNTTMTTAEIEQMKDAVKTLASETGASTDQLADGWMHISNLFADMNAPDKLKILDAAMRSAVSTGSDVGKTANTLAAAMKEFNVPAEKAAHTMDVLHLAAARGNVTLEQMVESGGKAIGMAANLGVSLEETVSTLSALSQHGFPSVALGATQFTGILTHIVNPSKQARDEIKRLSEATGIDLVSDFSAAGLKARGYTGVIQDVTAATKGSADEVLKLIPALRGGQGAMALAGTAAADYAATLNAVKGVTDANSPTAAAFARQQETAAAQMAKLSANVKVLAIDLGTVLLPVVNAVVSSVTAVVHWFTQLPGPVKAAGVVIALLTGACLVLVGVLGGLVVFAGSVATGFAAMGVTALGSTPPIAAMGVTLWTALAPVLPVIAVVTAGLILLGVIGYAIYRNWDKVSSAFQTAWGWLQRIVELTNPVLVLAHAVETLLRIPSGADHIPTATAPHIPAAMMNRGGNQGSFHVVHIRADGNVAQETVRREIRQFARSFDGATVHGG